MVSSVVDYADNQDDVYGCLKDQVTVLRVGSSCVVYGGTLSFGKWHTFDYVELETPTEDKPALLAKHGERHNYVLLTAYNGAGGTRTVKTRLGGENGTLRDTFSIKVVPFAIESMTIKTKEGQELTGSPVPLQTNTEYRLLVTLSSPYNRSWERELPNGAGWARSWVNVKFPAGSSMKADHWQNPGFHSEGQQVLGWRQDTTWFHIKTGATRGPAPSPSRPGAWRPWRTGAA